MTYVDLNPIRANIADTPEKSDYTSIQERIKPRWDLKKAIERQIKQKALATIPEPMVSLIKPAKLMPLDNQNSESLPFNLIDYLELIDWTERIVREDKRGYIKQDTPPILERLAIQNKDWLVSSNQLEHIYQKHFNTQRSNLNTS